MTEPCNRRAWVTLGALSVALEDYGGGWFCTSLDLGSPDVRDVTSNRPDQSGIDDRTQYLGGRAITAAITALAGAGADIDAVAAAFAPFMDPSQRPSLHYVLDRPGLPERVIPNLRAAGYTWPIEGAYQRDIQLQWVAPDPAMLDPTVQTVTAWAGSSTTPGRTYPLTFNRTYPPGGSSPTTGLIRTPGDLPIRPLLRIYGPITAPIVTVQTGGVSYRIFFQSGFIINAGAWVDVDTVAKSANLNSDPTQSVQAQINWLSTTWPVIAPNTNALLSLSGGSTTGVTQVQATWQDRYLT